MLTIFVKSNCPNCVAAKQLLTIKNRAYSEESLDNPEVRERFMAENPGIKQAPAIFENGRYIGGYGQLLTLSESWTGSEDNMLLG